MHPTPRSGYRVGVPLQPKAPLSCDRLGDAVLVPRANDGGELLEAGSPA